MKKLVLILTLFVLLSVPAFAGSTLPFYYNNEPILLSPSPVVQGGTPYLPFKLTFESLGYAVKWDATTKIFSATSKDSTIVLDPNKKIAFLNDKPIPMPTPIKVINSTVYVPLDFVANATNLPVKWNKWTYSIMIGEYIPDIIKSYEEIMTYSYDGKIVRFPELYTVNGTGKYAKYLKLMGHPATNYDLYFSIATDENNQPSEFLVIPKKNTDNQIVKWTYLGVKHSSTKGKLYQYFASNTGVSGYEAKLSKSVLGTVYGDVYYEWLATKEAETLASRILHGYTRCYLSDELSNTASYNIQMLERQKQEEAEKAAAEAARLKAEKEEEEYRAKEAELYKKFTNEWTTKRKLEQNYGISALWLGESIVFMKNGSKIYTITGSPKSTISENVIYNSSGIRFTFLKKVEFDFPESRDGEGKYTIEVNDIVFNTEDLKNAGVIK